MPLIIYLYTIRVPIYSTIISIYREYDLYRNRRRENKKIVILDRSCWYVIVSLPQNITLEYYKKLFLTKQ